MIDVLVFSFAICFIALVLHELVHALAARLLGVHVKRIVIRIFDTSYVEIDDNVSIDKVIKISLAPLILTIVLSIASLAIMEYSMDVAVTLVLIGIANLAIMAPGDLRLIYTSKFMGKSKAVFAILGVILVAAATLIQIVVDWYQSYAYGIPMSNVVKALVIAAGVLTLIALVISLKAGKGGVSR